MEAGNDLRNTKISWPDEFLTGIVVKPELQLSWSTDNLMTDADLSENMSRNRFEIILSNLHFNDNVQRPPDSPIQISQRGMP